MTKVFIDGEAGTTGLQIRARLEKRADLALTRLDDAVRKDPAARKRALNEADVVILCLPDGAARDAVALIENDATRVIDASTAHRTAPGWVYGLPELNAAQRAAVTGAKRVSNPGCYPTGAIALLRPLVTAGLLPKAWPVTINAVSGYSGGGKSLIAAFENKAAPNATDDNVRLYALGLGHKHVDEIRVHSGLEHRPLFAPSVGRFYRGMIVEIPLQLWALPGAPKLGVVHEALEAAYRGERFVRVVPRGEAKALETLSPERVNGTNALELYVFGNEAEGQARLVAVLDNLGKGASGAAVQTLNLFLGRDEADGLV